MQLWTSRRLCATVRRTCSASACSFRLPGLITVARCCSTSSDTKARWQDAASSSASSSSTRSPHANGYDQFRAQQQQYHRHSFYEKGSAAPHGNDEQQGQQQHEQQQQDQQQRTGSFSSTSERVKDERVYGHGSSTAQQRRQVRQQWEKSFFGRLHFDDGMHSRFAEALAAEEEAAYRESVAGETHASLFPRWPEDEEAPPAEFMRLRPALQFHYIVNRLSAGERRIRYAVDYGSLSMMYQLNLGEMMVQEAEKLLLELDWMNEDVAAQIDEVKQLAAKIKYDYDLD